MNHESDHEALAWCRLLRSGAGIGCLRRLGDRFNTAMAIQAAGRSAWLEAGMKPEAAGRLVRAGQHAEACDRAWLARDGHRVVGWGHPDYPPLLREIGSPPAALFVSGEVDLLWHPQLAVVGSRNPTAAGLEHAAAFSRALSRRGLAITSGLAAGIDASAHRAALDAGGTTVAVVATGPDRCYPRANAALSGRIEAEGALVSEHLPGTTARPQHFPSRNRIVAGLSLGTLVVEAAERSGALISARLAGDAGREVFAIPGSIRNPMARGCHRLIRQGAALVEHPDEVVEALAPLADSLAHALRQRLGDPIQEVQPGLPMAGPGPADPGHRRLWDALGHDPADLDTLARRTGLTVPQLSSMLLLMELEGCVSAEHGRFSRRH